MKNLLMCSMYVCLYVRNRELLENSNIEINELFPASSLSIFVPVTFVCQWMCECEICERDAVCLCLLSPNIQVHLNEKYNNLTLGCSV